MLCVTQIADSLFSEEFDSKMRRALQNKFAPSGFVLVGDSLPM